MIRSDNFSHRGFGLRSLLAAVAVVFASGLQLQAADIYVLSGSTLSGNSSTNFGKIDSDTGVYTNITSEVSSFDVVPNLSWNSAISAFHVTQNWVLGTNLRTLTTSGTLSSQIGTTICSSIYGMAYRPTNNTLYAYDFTNNDTGTISPTAGGLSISNPDPGLSASSPVGGRYSIQNDTIYMTHFNFSNSRSRFGTMGFANSSTFSQTGSDNSLFTYMVLASDGTTLYGLYGFNGDMRLYSIDPTNGATTFLTNVSGTGLCSWFYGAAIVPEPSNLCAGRDRQWLDGLSGPPPQGPEGLIARRDGGLHAVVDRWNSRGEGFRPSRTNLRAGSARGQGGGLFGNENEPSTVASEPQKPCAHDYCARAILFRHELLKGA